MDTRYENLKYLFHPRSIAFVGATETMGKWGFIIFNNLLRGGWKGRLYPVNPGRENVLGLKAYPSVKDIPDEIDLAVFTVPARHVMASIEECVAKGVKAGLVISAGFKEMGGKNVDLEANLVEKARAGNMVLAGPNGQGLCCTSERLFPWMAQFYPRPGTVAVASQSGNVMNMFIDGVVKSGLGITKAVSSGNEADMKIEDYFQYFADDPGIDVIMSYIEGMVDGTRFKERIKNITPKKPVVVLKGGRTHFGASAASSHTGAMAVSDDLFSAMCRQYGIIQARTIDEGGFLAASFVGRPLPRGNRIAIITGGGGLGVIASDRCYEEGLETVKLSDKTLDKLRKLLPDWWVPGNPVDLVAGLNPAVIMPIMEILIKSGEIDSLMLLFIVPPQSSWDATLTENAGGVEIPDWKKLIIENYPIVSKKLHDLSHDYNVPIYSVMNITDQEGISLAEKQGDEPVAICDNIEMTCHAVGEMYRYYKFRKKREK